MSQKKEEEKQTTKAPEETKKTRERERNLIRIYVNCVIRYKYNI
jgi:hypothetical protein